MIYKIIIFLLFIHLLGLYSCTSLIYKDKNIEELQNIAQVKKKYLCLFVGGGDQCSNCQYIIKKIENTDILTDFQNDYIFGQCNVGHPDNIFLHYVCMMEKIPTVYIFSPKGDLLAYLSDFSHIEYMQILLETSLLEKPEPQFKHNEFKSSFRKIIQIQNETLKAYKLSQTTNRDSLLKAKHYLQSSIGIEPYFYNLYLYNKVCYQLEEHAEAEKYKSLALNYINNHFQEAIYTKQIEELKSQ